MPSKNSLDVGRLCGIKTLTNRWSRSACVWWLENGRTKSDGCVLVFIIGIAIVQYYLCKRTTHLEHVSLWLQETIFCNATYYPGQQLRGCLCDFESATWLKVTKAHSAETCGKTRRKKHSTDKEVVVTVEEVGDILATWFIVSASVYILLCLPIDNYS